MSNSFGPANYDIESRGKRMKKTKNKLIHESKDSQFEAMDNKYINKFLRENSDMHRPVEQLLNAPIYFSREEQWHDVTS